MWNCNSITIIRQHLNIMRSTYELLKSEFVGIEMAFHDCVQGIHPLPKDQNSPGHESVEP